MKLKLRSILTVGLLTVILLSACAPAASSTPARPEISAQPTLQATEPPAPLAPSATAVQSQASPTEGQRTQAPGEVPQVVATSRGPELEASDPATVSFASGGLQLVEFFRFT